MEAAQFFIELAGILIAARLAGELANRFGAPSVIGELAAGIILGPSVLGWVEPTEIIRLLAEIEPREAQVLTLRFGLDGQEPLTLKQIGCKLELTRERVRQIQRSALTKLNELMSEE